MNLNAYDNITEKIDKTKTWIDTKKHLLLSREIKYRKYYVLCKRYEPELKTYNYYIALIDHQQLDKQSFNTKKDDYGRVKIRLHNLYDDSDLKYLEHDTNVYIELVTSEDDGEVYRLDI